MKRIILMVIRCLPFVPYWFYKLERLGRSDKFDEETRYEFVHKMTTHINRVGRVVIESDGQENLPEKRIYHFVLVFLRDMY